MFRSYFIDIKISQVFTQLSNSNFLTLNTVLILIIIYKIIIIVIIIIFMFKKRKSRFFLNN